MKAKSKHHKEDDFIVSARKAFRRVARQLRLEHAKSGLPLVFGDKGRLRLVYISPLRSIR